MQEDDRKNLLMLLVPEQFSYQSEKALIAATDKKGIWRAQVLSFHRLCYYVFGKTGGIGKKILEGTGKHMLIRKILNSNKNQMEYYQSVLDKRGFIDSLATLITEFYQYDISPQQLLLQAQNAKTENLRLKLMDMHFIYQAYKDYLQEHYISSDQLLDILAEKIKYAQFLHGANIWIDDFKSFTPQEKKVLLELFKVCECVKMTFCVDEGLSHNDIMPPKHNAFFEAKNTIKQINQMAKIAGAIIEPPLILNEPHRYNKAPDIAFLCNNFLGNASNTRYNDKPKNIRLFSTKNIFDEIHTAAKVITMLCRDRGYRYKEIGVVCSDLALYEKYIEPIFSKYSIPVFMDLRLRVLGNPLIEFIFAALEVIYYNWQYDGVFRLLRNPLCPISRDDVDIIENYALAYNIRGNAWLKPFVIGDEEELDTLNPIRQKVVDIMQPLMSRLKSGEASGGAPSRVSGGVFKIVDIAASIYQFLIINGVDARLVKWIAEANIRGDNAALRKNEHVWAKVMAALDKLVEILGDTTEGLDGFAKILETGAGDLGLAPPAIDQLVVGDMRRSRFGELKALIVMGANDGLMPSRQAADGLLSDADRHVLLENGVELAKGSINKAYEEEFLIYANFAKPMEYLSISYYTGYLTQKQAAPSNIISRLVDLMPKISITGTAKSRDSIANVVSPETTFNDMALAMGRYNDVGDDLPQIYTDVQNFFAKKPRYSNKLDNLKAALSYYKTNDKLSPQIINSLHKSGLRSSVSRLERFISCPFSYFAEYTLALKARKIYEAGAVDFGNIYHDVMHNLGVLLQKIDDVAKLDEADIMAMANNAVDQAMQAPQSQILSSSGRYMYRAQKMRKISQSSAMALVRHIQGGSFKLTFSELGFSNNPDGNDLGSIALKLDSGNMFLDGRVDRVDISRIGNADYVKIIDYKSGQKKFSLSEAYHGLSMQLLVYLCAFISKINDAQGSDGHIALPAAALNFNLLNPLIDFNPKFANNPNAIKAKLMESFKMSGVVLDEENIIFAMDEHLEASSHIIPVALKKDSKKGALSFKKESSVVSIEGFFALMEHVMHVARQTGNNILTGNITPKPAKHKDKYPCTYCPYHGICKLDITNQRNYNNLPYLKNDEVISKLLD